MGLVSRTTSSLLPSAARGKQSSVEHQDRSEDGSDSSTADGKHARTVRPNTESSNGTRAEGSSLSARFAVFKTCMIDMITNRKGVGVRRPRCCAGTHTKSGCLDPDGCRRMACKSRNITHPLARIRAGACLESVGA